MIYNQILIRARDIRYFLSCRYCWALFRLMVFLFKITTRQRQLDLLCHSDKQSWGWLNLTFCFLSFIQVKARHPDWQWSLQTNMSMKTVLNPVPKPAGPLWHYQVVPGVLLLTPECLTFPHLTWPAPLTIFTYIISYSHLSSPDSSTLPLHCWAGLFEWLPV